jgi:acyl-CoA dehydrogenase
MATAWVLNGTKLFITNGVHANLYFVAAKTGARQAPNVDVHRRKGHARFQRGSSLWTRPAGCALTRPNWCLDNVRLGPEALLGE